MDDAEHWSLLEELESKVDLDDPAEYRNVVQVMLTVLQSLRGNLPEPARDLLELAARFHRGAATAKALEAGRVAAWHLINGKDCNFGDPFVCSIRSLLCVMYPSATTVSPYNDLIAFMEFCDCAGYPPEHFSDALRSVYAGAIAKEHSRFPKKGAE